MSNLIDVGHITAAHGIKGWLKVRSLTEPADNLFAYQPWYLKTRHGVKAAEIVDWQTQNQGFLVKLKGIDDRNQAEQLTPVTIAVEKALLPSLPEGEYYWHQLIGCQVATTQGDNPVILGRVARLLATGANDVLVVVGDADSLDRKERLIPYVPEQFVKAIDLHQGTILVDWDPEF